MVNKEEKMNKKTVAELKETVNFQLLGIGKVYNTPGMLTGGYVYFSREKIVEALKQDPHKHIIYALKNLDNQSDRNFLSICAGVVILDDLKKENEKIVKESNAFCMYDFGKNGLKIEDDQLLFGITSVKEGSFLTLTADNKLYVGKPES